MATSEEYGVPLLPGSLSPGLDAPDKVLSIGQTELFGI